jgi:hypothetical protein
MRSIKVILVVFLIVVKPVFGQDNGSAAAGAVAGAIFAAVMTASAIEDYRELLELRATEDVMTNRPELNRFILRNLKINTSGTSDPSDAKYIPFGLIYWDENGESVKEMILMNCSSGWVNDAGVDYTKISMDYFTKEQVERLFKEYLSLAAQFNIDDLENIPELRLQAPKSKEADQYDRVQGIGRGAPTYYVSKSKYSISQSEFVSKGLTSDGTRLMVLPNLGDDGYMTTSFNEKLNIVYNEKSLGLFYKPLGELTKINHSTLNKIREFFYN